MQDELLPTQARFLPRVVRVATEMPIHDADIAALFTAIADLLDLEQANPFRIRAYRNAARVVSELGREVRSMIEHGECLTELPGIGDDLAGKMQKIVDTGSCRMLDKLQAEFPPAISVQRSASPH
jgi:DNA polymerase (family 10)